MPPTIKERSPIADANLAVPPCVILQSYGSTKEAMTRNHQLAKEALLQLDRLLQRKDLDRLIADYLDEIPEPYRAEYACDPEMIYGNLRFQRDECRQFMAVVAERVENYVPIVCPVCYQAAAMPFQVLYGDLGYDDRSSDAHIRLAHNQHDLIDGLLARPDLDDLLAAHARDCAADRPAAETPAQLRAELEGNRDRCRDFIHKALDRQFRRRHGPAFGRPL